MLEQGLADDRVIVAEERRADSQLEVDELATVFVPEPLPFAAGEVPRHDVSQRLVVPQKLGPGLSEHCLGAPPQGLLSILATEPATKRRPYHAVSAPPRPRAVWRRLSDGGSGSSCSGRCC